MGTVIFDLDGTLADTSGDLIAAANHCFRDMGLGDLLDPAGDALTAFHGGRAMLTLGLTRAGHADVAGQVGRYYPVLLQAYGDAIDVHTRLYPGAMEAVAALQAAGYRVGICTNKPEALADTLLRRLGVRDSFAALVGADTLPVRKPDPAPLAEAVSRAGGDMRRACLIGDTDTDRQTARAAGVPSVLVTFGPSGDAVLALKPEAHIGHYDELAGVVAGLFGPA
ncbi:HAD-IA family hydrolase [Lutimaribacter sp. EGI FJ00015]|uniref:HAD-IA family hydrolase n=1 Tax=Lutimaribacter degradans TaxID=2945989 RepID=A0ACC5ZR85_9RHOB|nr:HAD-IA family hydrolase [Lutimaribacter sp. EGI FJ00013]MCM2560843.1 HAD-IA family hydrolase [Lutimaribacter sp. EGI FJ00013]MCO0612212.1 HAD-IA family hydrolase [Lutimaribacter sp. EGI FJ00015]MCO0634668.1 HAD-IA family hydrolase [Lutimaribacter sp. EGI FJ00014]